MIILGINAYHGDSSACIIKDGELIAAVEEERFRRTKHWAGFPSEAIKYCLKEADISTFDIDYIAVNRNPKANLYKKVLFTLSKRPNFSLIKNRLSNMAKVQDIKKALSDQLRVSANKVEANIYQCEHHRAHMGSTFFVSPFERAAILSIDGFGDFVSTMMGEGINNKIKVLNQVNFPHSLGLFYTAITQFLGFAKYGDEYKVMGLAAYGEPTYLKEMEKIVRLKKDGKFELNLDYFLHHSEGVDMTWEGESPVIGQVYSQKLINLFGPPRKYKEEITEHHENIASSLQAMYEKAFFHILNYLYEKTKNQNLCLAGGCAFNSVANGKIFDNTLFKEIYIHPAAGDAGGATGSAYYLYHQILNYPRNFVMTHAFWGPEYSNKEIEEVIKKNNLNFQLLNEEDLINKTVQSISEKKIVGWYQGRTEWGPRALGNRSILADPREAEMKDILNARIKHREPFRPFAPSILMEEVGEYFEKTYPDPFMIKVYPVKNQKRSIIPAVTHIDGSGRLQTVVERENRLYYRLIEKFFKKTGVPVLLNTSFNENEPIVNTPQEAIDCFLRTKMDVLVLGNFFIRKSDT